ncbi:hypothetical protein [uncultured Amphritea sp.]|uniref:hypothetical protein n=1 Tax=uncultured Amphritea sp. TaxID=981605 RepID=UPI00262F640F|nr:hypothetical protein [uncultured Amphritea sp.]
MSETFTYDDLWGLCEACVNEQVQAFIAISGYCWLKPSEVLNLSFRDVADGVLSHGDNVAILPPAVRSKIHTLQIGRGLDSLIFQSFQYKKARPISSSFVRKKIANAKAAAGFTKDVHPETFRKLYGRAQCEGLEGEELFEALKRLNELYRNDRLPALAAYLGVSYSRPRGRPITKVASGN